MWGGYRYVGNQVEVQMFSGTGWALDESGKNVKVVAPSDARSLTIEKRFEFDHHTMTMSVVVRDPKSGRVYVFCKGAPEKIAQICDPTSVPDTFSKVAQRHAVEGCYVIGISVLSLGNLSEDEVQQLQRNNVEQSGKLGLLGLLLFRNELKSDTATAIEMIKTGDVRPVMVTGDNAHCGYYIAQQCKMVEPGTIIFLGNPADDGSGLRWSSMSPDASESDLGLTTEEAVARCESSSSELALTGKAVQVLTASGELTDLLLHTRIFARVKPDQKADIVELFIKEGYITGMCGDGGNDCGALRTAHCGIALSDAEASVVSPFTARGENKTIMSVVHVLCEGRCSLVTSFAAYRFYIMYGLNW